MNAIISFLPLVILVVWFILCKKDKGQTFKACGKELVIEQNRHEFRKAAKLYR